MRPAQGSPQAPTLRSPSLSYQQVSPPNDLPMSRGREAPVGLHRLVRQSGNRA
jgi:hypothetical protein